MRLLFTIVERRLMEQVVTIYFEEANSYCIEIMGKGTASSEIMDMLGLGSPDKALVLGIVNNNQVERIYTKLEEKMKLKTKATGVSFSVPVSAIGKSTAEFLLHRLEQKTN